VKGDAVGRENGETFSQASLKWQARDLAFSMVFYWRSAA
jgi:hypothetical protein